MDKFATSPDRQAVLQEAANARGLTEIVVEKDFWVCWVLRQISLLPDLAPHLTFKGGTSLSKAYGLIQRFSEDVDLTIGRDAPFLVDGADPMEAGISNNERARRIEDLRQNAQKFVHKVAFPALKKSFQAVLGTEGWRIELDPEDNDNQTILFWFPKVFEYRRRFKDLKDVKNLFAVPDIFGEWEDRYILPRVKLEFGARGEVEPHEIKTITPYVTESFLSVFSVKEIAVSTLSVERTFWEKVTILHALHHGSNMRDRMSRHYYDTYQMAQAGIAQRALVTSALLEQVVRNKSLMFRDAKASYETAKLGNLKLRPRPENIETLKRDYIAMEEMFMDDPPSFEDILNGLTQLEEQLNA